jgi:response regulator of citrate/malate metabolism
MEDNMAEAVETKHDKFKRLANQRVANALKKIELIGNLSSSGYEYSQEEVDKIFSVLQQTLDSSKNRFAKGKKEETKKFEL